MSLLLVIAVAWVVLLVLILALLRTAVIADAASERHVRDEPARRAGDRFGEPAASSHRFARPRERSRAGR
jgi:hypothetical protein